MFRGKLVKSNNLSCDLKRLIRSNNLSCEKETRNETEGQIRVDYDIKISGDTLVLGSYTSVVLTNVQQLPNPAKQNIVQ